MSFIGVKRSVSAEKSQNTANSTIDTMRVNGAFNQDIARFPGALEETPKLDPASGRCLLHGFEDLELKYDCSQRLLWQYMKPKARPSFTRNLLREMTFALDLVVEVCGPNAEFSTTPISFLVLASKLPGIFSLGGDLPLFIALIEARDRAGLTQYARICAEGQYRRSIDLDLPLCTIALVQGDALGGGFEAALANDFIIAERGVNFGLPEVLFNLFPGMGAVSFLTRRLDRARAERMTLSGRIYSAEELYEMGVVDYLADPGCGNDAVEAFVRDFERAAPARLSLIKARRVINPVTLEELVSIADLWVDAALQLTTADLRRMQHLAKAQDRRRSRAASQ